MQLTRTASFRAPASELTAVAKPNAQTIAGSTAPVERSQRTQPASVTQMRAPKVAHEVVGHAPNPKETLQKAVGDMEERQKLAKARDVNVAKKTFWRKFLGGFAAGVGIAVAASTVIATGGAALAVVAASIAVGVGVLAVADAWLARLSLKNAQAREKGETPPYTLPMEGASALANLSCWCLKKMGVSEERSKKISLGLDAGVKLGFAIGTAVTTLGLDTAISNADKVIPILTAAGGLLQSVADMKVDEERSKVLEAEEEHLATIRKQIEALETADTSKDEEIAMLKAQVEAVTADLQAREQSKPVAEEQSPLVRTEVVEPHVQQQQEPSQPAWHTPRSLAEARRIAAALLPDLPPQVQRLLNRSWAISEQNYAALQAAGYLG